jgi:hypothetical protein
MTTAQVEFRSDELLADHEDLEPLVADGVVCHGGFDEDGTYVSPRTRNRTAAIEAWEEQRATDFGTELLDVGLDTWPEPFPNVAQTKLLLERGVRHPTVSALTRIGTAEGFGSMLRLLPPIDWQPHFVEDVRGTATSHLFEGLFEAHARDEAGHEDVAGHDRMWFAARDIAFERPVTEDESELMLERMGIVRPGAKLGTPDAINLPPRVLPDDVDHLAEIIVSRMISLLFIEISAFHTFAWAEEVLADTDLVAGEGEAARIISYVRADEAPHVAYLRTTLSEMRDRTWVGSSGRRYPGTEIIGTLWDQGLETSTMVRRGEFLRQAMGELRIALDGRADADDLLEEVLALGRVRLAEDGTLVDETDRRAELRRGEATADA